MSTKTPMLIAAVALLAAPAALAGPRQHLVKQLPTESLARAADYAMDVHRLEGDLATKHAQQAWARDWKHVSETEIYGLESETDIKVDERDGNNSGAVATFETKYDTEHLGDVEVDARMTPEYLAVLDEQDDAIEARLDLAKARYDLFLAVQIDQHVKPGFNVDKYRTRMDRAAQDYGEEFTEVEAAELAYRNAGGTASVRPLVFMDYQYEIDSGVDDWDVERNMTLR